MLLILMSILLQSQDTVLLPLPFPLAKVKMKLALFQMKMIYHSVLLSIGPHEAMNPIPTSLLLKIKLLKEDLTIYTSNSAHHAFVKDYQKLVILLLPNLFVLKLSVLVITKDLKQALV